MSRDDDDEPDLTGAEVFVEADRPVAGGHWYVLPKVEGQPDRVIYQRPNGEFEHRSVVSADTLRNSTTTWRPI